MPELSVIVPVYKAENFLTPCVESLLSQSVSDLEIVLVEDGSPDRSGELCDALAERDPRIQVIHQENAGVSCARNRGLQQAKGTYVGFVDSDDWVDSTMYAQLLALAAETGAEIAGCDGLYISGEDRQPDTVKCLPESRVLTHGDMTPDVLIELACSACYRVYRRSFLQAQNIQFPVGMKFSEDRVFNLYAMGYAQKVGYLKKPLYMRRVNPDSCVRSYHKDRFSYVQQAQNAMEAAIETAWKDTPQCRERFLDLYVDGAGLAVEDFRHPDCPLSLPAKIREIRRICKDPKLQGAIRQFGYGYETGQLMLKKRALSLYYVDTGLYRKLANVEETLQDGGLSGIFRKIKEKLRNES